MITYLEAVKARSDIRNAELAEQPRHVVLNPKDVEAEVDAIIRDYLQHQEKFG